MKFLIFAAFTLILLAGCKFIVNKLAFYPDAENILPAEQLPTGVEERFIRTEDGVQVFCLYLPYAGSDKIVIFFHGNAGNIYHRIPDLMQLQRSGVNVLGVSYRGYARSEGRPSEQGIYRDGDAAFAYVTEELGFAPEKVIIFGRSIGTAVAVHLAQFREIAGLILVTPLTSGLAQAKSSGLRSVAFLAGNAFDNLSRIKNVRSPLLVIHGTRDSIIPYAMGREIFDQATVAKQFVAIEGADHNDIQDRFRAQYWPPILEFVKSR